MPQPDFYPANLASQLVHLITHRLDDELRGVAGMREGIPISVWNPGEIESWIARQVMKTGLGVLVNATRVTRDRDARWYTLTIECHVLENVRINKGSAGLQIAALDVGLIIVSLLDGWAAMFTDESQPWSPLDFQEIALLSVNTAEDPLIEYSVDFHTTTQLELRGE